MDYSLHIIKERESKKNTHQTTALRNLKKEQSLKKKAESASKVNIDQNLKENMTKLIQKRLGSKEEDIFVQLIASKLSSIPANDKLFTKHEINEVIFNCKRQQKQSNNPYLMRRERIENMRQASISPSLLTLTPLPAHYQFQGSGFQGNQRADNVCFTFGSNASSNGNFS